MSPEATDSAKLQPRLMERFTPRPMDQARAIMASDSSSEAASMKLCNDLILSLKLSM